jgi:hypothetical protein
VPSLLHLLGERDLIVIEVFKQFLERSVAFPLYSRWW